MDAYRPYMRPPAPETPPPPPPPSSSVDPHYHQYQQQAAVPSRPPHGPWFPNQFQYNNPSQSGSTPPPPPWAPPHPPPPPPQSDHPPPPAYPAPPHPYPPHHAQFPPRPYAPPPQHPNLYAPQDWNNPNWGYQQGWNHQAQNDAEDWAARAKAWANAKASMESQHSQAHYQNQYPQAVESQSVENHQLSSSGSAYQQHPHSATRPHGPPVHFQENPSIGAIPPSYLPDGRVAYSANNGPLGGDPNAVFHHQELHRPVNQSVHQQEVPSSYSSVSGKGENRDQNEILHLHLPSSAAQEGMGHLQAPRPAADGSVYPYGNQYTNPLANPADQPLEFTSRFNRDQDLLAQSVYAHHDSSRPLRGIDPVNMRTSSVTPDVAYPSIHAVLPSGPQHDPSIAIPPHVSGHATPAFPRFSGPSFQPSISPPGGNFGMGAGPLMPPSGGFSADSYALPGSAGRPKKAPVPNWLREEIIKTKASITSSSLGHPKDEAQSVEDEGADKSFEKDDQADSKSIDSSKSTEGEDGDEDYAEAAKNAAINQEIKRVLTEVLLKVTDELFDEIAMKVLNEDDHVAEDTMVSSTSHATTVTRTSTKAPTLVENKGLENEGVSEKSSSSAGRNILGLATYASDDEDGEIQTSDVPNSSNPMKWDSKGAPADVNDPAKNGTQRVEVEEQVSAQANSDSGYPRTNLLESNVGGDSGNNKVNGADNSASLKVSPIGDQIHLNGKIVDIAGASFSKEIFEEKVNKKSKLLDEKVDARKSAVADTRDTEARLRPIVTERDDNKRTAAGDSSKGPESIHVKVDQDLGENQRKDERRPRKEKAESCDSKETKDLGKHGEKMKESEGRKRPANSDIKEDRKDRERLRDNAKDDSRRSERSWDKGEDRSRHKASHDLNRHKRRRSSSTGSRGRNSRENLATHGKDSSGEDSYDSRRKLQSRRRNLSPSPSPVRSRRRQVSRSPHSKHSQRRHSPYSSLEGSRERRRSRSRSPVRRHR